MEEEKNDGEKWVDDVGSIIETYRNLITIRVVEHTSLGASFSAVGIVCLIFLLCILLFFGLGAAWWIGELMQNRVAGFFIVGGTYLVLLCATLLMAQKFIIPLIRNLIIKKIYEQD